MTNLIQQPDGTWAEDAPPDCPVCSLAWPFDGSTGRVIVGTAVGGRRYWTCQGCGHTTWAVEPHGESRREIGAAPDGEVAR